MASSFLKFLAASALVIPHVAARSGVDRVLKAAALHSDIAKRGNGVPIRRNVRLDYFEDNMLAAEPIGAQVDLRGKTDSLLLEEIDHMLEEVHCEAGQIELKFMSHHFSGARETIESHSELMIITSHHGCSDAGTRTPYRVVDKTFSDSDGRVNLELAPASWEKDYRLELGFAPEDRNNYQVNRHDHLRRRQIPTAPTQAASQAETVTQSTISFPSPTEDTDASSASSDVGGSLIDQVLFPPSQLPGLIVAELANQVPGIELTCRNCTTTGTINFESARFDLGGGLDMDDLTSVRESFVSVRADNLAAAMAFSATWTPALDTPLDISLPAIPLTPIAIPGLASFGITFIPHIIFGVTVSSEVTFDYGFTATVPSGSSAFVDFFDATNSSAAGFDRVDIAPLPFDASVPTLGSARFYAMYQPEILLGAVVATQEVGAGIFVNMPELAVTFSAVNGTDASCNLVNGTASEELREEADRVEELFGALMLVEPEVGLAAGFQIQVGDVAQTAWTPLATQFPLPTACFAFVESDDGESSEGESLGDGSFVPASRAYASATAEANGESGAGFDDSGVEALRANVVGLLFGLVAGVFVMVV